jgi:hypothetical protein
LLFILTSCKLFPWFQKGNWQVCFRKATGKSGKKPKKDLTSRNEFVKLFVKLERAKAKPQAKLVAGKGTGVPTLTNPEYISKASSLRS